MIFSGELPRWAYALNEFCKVERNLNRDEIFSQLREASCYVYTSKFDSFALPIFEALYVGCPVVALRNECIHLNNTDQYVWVVENEIELETVLHRFTQNRIDLVRFQIGSLSERDYVIGLKAILDIFKAFKARAYFGVHCGNWMEFYGRSLVS